MRTSKSEVPAAERAQIVKELEKTDARTVAKKHDIPVRWAWDFRYAMKGKTRKAKAPQAGKSRRTFTDAQKRLILRVAQDTSASEAAERFKINTALIYKWKKKYRPSRKVRKRVNGGKPSSPIAFAERPRDLPDRAAARELHELRVQLGQALEENQELRTIIVDQTLRLRRLENTD